MQDPYGYSSLGLMQAADKEEFLKATGQDELFLNFDKQQMAMNCLHSFACLEVFGGDFHFFQVEQSSCTSCFDCCPPPLSAESICRM